LEVLKRASAFVSSCEFVLALLSSAQDKLRSLPSRKIYLVEPTEPICPCHTIYALKSQVTQALVPAPYYIPADKQRGSCLFLPVNSGVLAPALWLLRDSKDSRNLWPPKGPLPQFLLRQAPVCQPGQAHRTPLIRDGLSAAVNPLRATEETF